MKYVAKSMTQVKIDGKIITLDKDAVVDLPDDAEITGALKPVEENGYSVNFAKAKKEELMVAKWKLADIQEACKALYGTELQYRDDDTKETLVDRFLDIRYRSINPTVTNPTVATPAS